MDWWYLTAFALLASWALAFGLGWFVRRGQGPREDDTQRVTFEQLKSMPLPDFGPHELQPATPPEKAPRHYGGRLTPEFLERMRAKGYVVPNQVAEDWQRIVTGGGK